MVQRGILRHPEAIVTQQLALANRSVAPAVTVRVDDPAFVEADALARPTNAELRATTSLMRRLEDAAGPWFTESLRVHAALDVGAAVVTAGGALESDLLIHCVVMTDDDPVTRTGVQRATSGALQRAADWRVSRLAMVPFGLGAGNLDVDDSAQAMAAAIREHRGVYPRELVFVVENEVEADVFRRVFPAGGARA